MLPKRNEATCSHLPSMVSMECLVSESASPLGTPPSTRANCSIEQEAALKPKSLEGSAIDPPIAPLRAYQFNSTGSFARVGAKSASSRNLKDEFPGSILFDNSLSLREERAAAAAATKAFEAFAGCLPMTPQEYMMTIMDATRSDLVDKIEQLYHILFTLSKATSESKNSAKSKVHSPRGSGPILSRWGSVDSALNCPALVEKHGATYGTDEIGNETINEYTILADLGRGAYGKVTMACDEQTQRFVAIKTMNKGVRLKGENDPVAMSEIAVMKKLRHKNIVSLLEVIDDEEEGVVHLVMEYVNQGPVLRKRDDGTWPTLPESVARQHLRQIITGLQYLHNHGIAHRDIKPDNVLVDADGHIYLVDFGVSEILQKEVKHSTKPGQVGTYYFFSPEMCSGDPSEDGIKSDVWALGVLLYLMLFGKFPFSGTNPQEIMHSIQHCSLKFPDAAPMVIREVLEGLLEKDPAKRTTLRKLRSHPFTTNLGTLPMEAVQSIRPSPPNSSKQPSTGRLRITSSASSAEQIALSSMCIVVEAPPSQEREEVPMENRRTSRKNSNQMSLTTTDLHGAVRRRTVIRRSRCLVLGERSKVIIRRYITHVQEKLKLHKERKRQSVLVSRSASIVEIEAMPQLVRPSPSLDGCASRGPSSKKSSLALPEIRDFLGAVSMQDVSVHINGVSLSTTENCAEL